MAQDHNDQDESAWDCLSSYLAEPVSTHFSRQRCPGCHASVTIYCHDCLDVMLPRETWPASVAAQALRLPFQLDILLDDRRASSTGVQVASILKAAGQETSFRIYDLTKCEDDKALPDYTSTDADDNHDGTYLLFPDSSAVTLSSVIKSGKPIKRIIVMDCKWSKFSKTLVLPLHKAVADVPRIKLELPAHVESFYWRWHNAGDGAVSTIEAIYYAAHQISGKCVLNQQENVTASMDILDIFWLFRLQRNIIANRYEQESIENRRAFPFSAEGKEYNRALRRGHSLQQAESELDVAMEG
ncbi:hypothetical protein MPSEU_000505400 [Mayamaea pseudoterrestris]|nr:hypothetical protein MPSEU_000505400 [Mayamaea pseudoterrestris]